MWQVSSGFERGDVLARPSRSLPSGLLEYHRLGPVLVGKDEDEVDAEEVGDDDGVVEGDRASAAPPKKQ